MRSEIGPNGEYKIIMCCLPPANPCCPEIFLEKNERYVIRDDYGSEIKIKQELMPDIINQIKKIKKDD